MQAATSNTSNTSNTSTLPTGIEIFRAGTRTDDSGRVHTITEADVVASAAAYDPALHEAALTVGHPESDRPAYGWVRRLVAEDGVLKIAEHAQVEPQFAEMVRAGRFKKRSAAFYMPTDPANPKPGVWYLRHVANLGAQPPAIKGLKDIQFSEAADAVCFSEPIAQTTAQPNEEQDDMTKELQLQAQLDEANAKLAQAEADAAAAKKTAEDAKSQAAQFAEKARNDRKAQFVSFAEAQLHAGILTTPEDRTMAVAAMVALDNATPVEFSEGDTTRKVTPVQWLQDLIAGAAPKVQFGEFAGGRLPEAGAAKGKSDAEIDKAAKAYALQHKVNYAEALSAVTSFGA